MEHIAAASRTFGLKRVSSIHANEWQEIAAQLRAALPRSVAYFCSDAFVSYLNSKQADALVFELDRLGYVTVIEALRPLLDDIEGGDERMASASTRAEAVARSETTHTTRRLR